MKTFFFFNDTATTEIYTLSLHDALPISRRHETSSASSFAKRLTAIVSHCRKPSARSLRMTRSEEHTSELQSLTNLVCRLLLEKKNLNIFSFEVFFFKPKFLIILYQYFTNVNFLHC